MQSTLIGAKRSPAIAAAFRLGFAGIIAAVFAVCSASAQIPDPPGQCAPGEKPVHEAYLFAHMRHGDYWRLYYSVSLDGLRWELLNGGKRVFDEYRGHADIAKGHDGRYYLVGNRGDDQPDINFWVSDDLLHWTRYSDFSPDLKSVPDFPKAIPTIGAPKLFFDQSSGQYLLTWHTTQDLGKTDLPEPYWAGQRTLFVTSKDLKTFSHPPRKLFGWDMATIDTIVRPIGGRYYAIFKDERYPTFDWPSGKTIRVCSAPNLLGPYSQPGPPISPSFREAPTLIPSPNGKAWYLYYEQYPGVAYGLSAAVAPDGPWIQIAGGMNHRQWDQYAVPPKVRHGSMMVISRRQYDALRAAFPGASTNDMPSSIGTRPLPR